MWRTWCKYDISVCLSCLVFRSPHGSRCHHLFTESVFVTLLLLIHKVQNLCTIFGLFFSSDFLHFQWNFCKAWEWEHTYMSFIFIYLFFFTGVSQSMTFINLHIVAFNMKRCKMMISTRICLHYGTVDVCCLDFNKI